MVEEKITDIFSNLRVLYNRADDTGLDTNAVALQMAQEKLEGAAK